MEELIFIATRQLAKRQMTWLRNWPDEITWLDSGEDERFLVEKFFAEILRRIS